MPRVAPRQTIARRPRRSLADLRTHLNQIALEVFAQTPWQSCCYADLAQRAGVTLRTAKRAYARLEDCLIAVADQFHQQAFAQPSSTSQPSLGDEEDQLTAILDGFLETVDEQPQLARTVARILAGIDGPIARTLIQPMRIAQRQQLQRLIATGQRRGIFQRTPAADLIADEWLSALYGHALLGVSSSVLKQLLLRGLLKRDA
ncbi:TetR/AcrR family transcriptional regulator [Tuwongella immobilis]|uniref:Family transcriptional regulator n=1 Tax=Tuwongella immobilis TaxID=692036 RepID=A0A6C2YJ81_9BACT|nr:TetR/AcrR family transcriptional regulator [Tuwongella immobilis]VIP01456.1 family transcriptional regulator : [Tuwongella immobilis]VTR98460.1 family transcriptional regulator : [Tuwongella immobilis]